MGTFYIENFGCRATQADGAAIERQFQEQGLQRAGAALLADVVVLNTCTVTAAADHDARAAIRRVKRSNPNAKIVVTGCYAQRAPAELASLPGVTLVVGNSHKHELAEIALANSAFVPADTLLRQPASICNSSPATDVQRETSGIFVSDIFAHTELLAAPVFDAPNERTRPNLKVQDGCDNRCSFCVIPYVRGQSRSLHLERVVHEARTLVGAGYRELVISGINLGRWGRDLDATPLSPDDRDLEAPRAPMSNQRLVALVRAILDQTSLEKVRISSVEPMDWTEDLITLMARSPRIAKHAHVPMQSGSDTVLRRMHRKYRPWHYREKILKIREAMPDAAIGADVMVGFPGETDYEFGETLRMVEDLPFTYLHVFTYSARPGTPAAVMQGQVEPKVSRERSTQLRELAAQKKQDFMQSFVGRNIQAVTLKANVGTASALTEALTDNYLKLRLKGAREPNRWITADIERVEAGELVGH